MHFPFLPPADCLSEHYGAGITSTAQEYMRFRLIFSFLLSLSWLECGWEIDKGKYFGHEIIFFNDSGSQSVRQTLRYRIFCRSVGCVYGRKELREGGKT